MQYNPVLKQMNASQLYEEYDYKSIMNSISHKTNKNKQKNVFNGNNFYQESLEHFEISLIQELQCYRMLLKFS